MTARNQLDSDKIDEITKRCISVIDGHQHREAIRESDLREWLSFVVPVHGEAAIWHATRAGGFGGSDIGVLVRNFAGERADHQASAHDIVEAKLLRSVPDEDTGVLRRGHFMEPHHAAFFTEKWAAKRDQEAFDALTKTKGTHPWMRYSPDEMVLMPSEDPNPALGGRKVVRVLADYKAPTVVDENDEIKFQYSCQLHQGAILCAESGIHLDGLMLSQFDWARWSTKDDVIAWSPELARQILNAGDHYWEYVLRGEVPAFLSKGKLVAPELLVQRFLHVGESLAYVKAIQKAAEDHGIELAKLMRPELSAVRFGRQKLEIGALKVSVRQMVDVEKVLEAVGKLELTPQEMAGIVDTKAKGEILEDKVRDVLVRLGAKPDQLDSLIAETRRVKLNAEKAHEFLLAKGFDADALIEEQLVMAPSKLVKEGAESALQALFPLKNIQPLTELQARKALGLAAPEQDETPETQVEGTTESDGPQLERQAPRN